MSIIQRVLVVGGGFTGLTAGIALAQRGVEVTIVDRAPAWARVGHGLTIQGNALRVFEQLGVIDQVLDVGCAEEHGVTLFFADGRVMTHLDTPRTGGAHLPPTIGALRPDLHDILVAKAESEGVRFRLGTEMTSFDTDGDRAKAALSDGTSEEWDLIIVAEGIRSKSRATLGIHEVPASSGLGIWRAVTARRPDMHGGIAFPSHDDGGALKVGYTPVNDTQCYVFVLCRPERPDNGLADWLEVRRLMDGYHGEFDFLRESIVEDTFLNFQVIEWLFVEGPWHRGRVIALGEAVHAVPPLIAQGAAQCLEDAIILVDQVCRPGDLEQQLTEFHDRRVPRVRTVVNASMQLAAWEREPGSPDADPGRVMGEALHALMVNP